MQYLFIFGRDSALSFGELISYFKKENIENKLVDFNESGAVFEIKNFDLRRIKEFGGIVKIAKVELIFENLNDLNFDELGILDYFPEKFAYGINFFGNFNRGELSELFKKYFKKRRFKYLELKGQEINSGILISPTDVIKKKLIESQSDFVFFGAKKKYFARTIAVSNVLETEKRDLSRPSKNPLEAISIRLAKILINLAQIRKGEILLDPFCGIGTILQEAYIQKIDFRGVDISKERVKDAIINLKSIGANPEKKIISGNSACLSRYFKENSIDGIATEPYLGPLIKKVLSPEEARINMKELEQLYQNFFLEAAKILKKESIMAVVLPYFKTKSEKVFLNMGRILPNSLKIYNPLDGITEKGFPLEYEERKIGRIIYIFKKEK